MNTKYFENLVNQKLLGLHTCYLATVISVNGSYATVQPLALIKAYDKNSINASRDIESAYGKTLDNYGAMVGVARNGITDEQYVTRILNKIAAVKSTS